jgi:predicted nuclease of predicted toxin-antitoxin system
MKILIDECLPAALKRSFIPHDHQCSTVREAGFGSKKNGEPLTLADGIWDALVTSDKSMRYQQNVSDRRISILVMRARSNRLLDLLPLVPACLETLRQLRPGQIVEIGQP